MPVWCQNAGALAAVAFSFGAGKTKQDSRTMVYVVLVAELTKEDRHTRHTTVKTKQKNMVWLSSLVSSGTATT